MNRVNDDEGFTITELLVALTVSMLVVAIVTGIVLSGMSARDRVMQMTTATQRGDVISRSIETGVRNSSAYDVGEPWADGSQLLRARVAVGVAAEDITWTCQAWYYDDPTGSIWTMISDSAIPEMTSPAVLTGWTLVAEGIELSTADAEINATATATPSATPDPTATPGSNFAQVFSGSAGELRLQFVVTDGDVALVLVPNTIVQQITATGGDGPATCF